MRLPKINKYVGMLLVAIVLAFLSVFLIVKYLHQTKSQYQAELQNKLSQGMVQVVVPTMNLKAGVVVNGQNMAQRLFPKDLLYPGTVTSDDWRQYAGHVLRRDVVAGKPLLADDFNKQQVSEFAALLRPGTRAVTITVDDVNSIAGMLRPGDHIDVMLETSQSVVPQTGSGSDTTQQNLLPLLQRALVLATGNDLGLVQKAATPGAALADQFGTVTLELTPKQASELMLARQLGSFRIALTPVAAPAPGSPTMPMQDSKELIAKLSGTDTATLHGVGPIQLIVGSGQGITQQVMYSGMAPAGKPATGSPAVPTSTAPTQEQELEQLKNLLKNQTPAALPASSSGAMVNH